MIKRIIVFFCLAAVVSCGVMFYWPQPFTKVIDENVGFYVRYTETVMNATSNPQIDHLDTEIFIEPGTEQYEEFMNKLGNYSYHRSLRTYFGDSSVSWVGNESIQIFSSPDSITNVGAKEIIIGTKVYHLGYWGDKTAQSMLQDIKGYVQGKDL